ncbi:4336_t:CDS:2 [Funneliformis mosseae]|uniref:4336_t:CDS:1 n=1 Tax=Funneliformis mosseae TaxID=27381 RepID=A0A9N9DMX0_FUNMO|nr:4336_t:CDS:2 [Funneliformis mosseae]
MDSPTAWNINDERNLLRLNEDKHIVTYTGLGEIEDCAAIRTNYPIPDQCGLFYFEVDIIDKGKNGEIGIGFCTRAACLNQMPGWEDISWGYHGDDGNIFNAGSEKLYGPTFMTGDTIGCCLNFRNNTVFYTRNGVNLGIAFQDLKNALYPCVGMLSPGGSIGANFGYRKFKYTGEYRQAIADLIKLREFEANNTFALRYQEEIYCNGKYNSLLIISII